MEHLLTFTTGRNTNQTTFTMRIVFTLLDSFRIISTNGTTSIAQTATNSPARKVEFCPGFDWFLRVYIYWWYPQYTTFGWDTCEYMFPFHIDSLNSTAGHETKGIKKTRARVGCTSKRNRSITFCTFQLHLYACSQIAFLLILAEAATKATWSLLSYKEVWPILMSQPLFVCLSVYLARNFQST